ncbi:MAG: hypothetical protein WBE37_05975 [Bryobacteraceae bacterium]
MSHAGRSAAFKSLGTFGGTHVWQLKGAPHGAGSSFESAFFFECGLTVDADGARTAYGPHGLAAALDNLGNAGHPGNWWGLVTDKHHQPIVQSGIAPQQPCRGFYISQTSLYDSLFDETDVRRFVDAERIPYIALPQPGAPHPGHPPQHYFRKTGLRLGDFALLINANNGKYCFAVFADSKNKPNLGEVSICASGLLGAPTDAKHGSLPRGVIKLVFPGSGIGQATIPNADTIARIGKASLEHFSNYRDKNNTLLAAYPEYPGFAGALIAAGY